MLELKRERDRYAEALVLLKVNPNLSAQELSRILKRDEMDNFQFTDERMDILTDFWMRDIFFTLKKKKSGHDILSPKQTN